MKEIVVKICTLTPSFPAGRRAIQRVSLMGDIGSSFSLGHGGDVGDHMRTNLVIVLVSICAQFAGCASPTSDSGRNVISENTLVHGLDDGYLNYLAQRLGCRVEALGMSDYLFSCRSFSFHVLAQNDVSVERRVQADEPVIFRYKSSKGDRSFESQLPVSQGVKLGIVEEHFRSFIRRIEEGKSN